MTYFSSLEIKLPSIKREDIPKIWETAKGLWTTTSEEIKRRTQPSPSLWEKIQTPTVPTDAESTKKKFPYWIIAVVSGVVLLSIVGFIAFRRRK